ncbi:diphthamide synthesis protein [Candidatus Woesearchaeota archaeon]|nr:diphthamide synthesis protein [Candidatus Woesearchaeota archaeon]
MKTFFIEAKVDAEILLEAAHVAQLPMSIGLVTNIQHLHRLEDVRTQLEAAGKRVTIIKGFHSKHAGQMYGCDFPANTDSDIEAVLFIGTGRFHPRGTLASGKELFVFDPVNRHFYRLDPYEAEEEQRKIKAAYAKFLHSTEIGILVSTKPGQLHLKAGQALKRIYPDKNYYYLVSDTVDFTELQNFPFIECYVNTACPRMMEDYDKFSRPVINIEELMRNLGPEQRAATKHPYPLYTQVA